MARIRISLHEGSFTKSLHIELIDTANNMGYGNTLVIEHNDYKTGTYWDWKMPPGSRAGKARVFRELII